MLRIKVLQFDSKQVAGKFLFSSKDLVEMSVSPRPLYDLLKQTFSLFFTNKSNIENIQILIKGKCSVNISVTMLSCLKWRGPAINIKSEQTKNSNNPRIIQS